MLVGCSEMEECCEPAARRRLADDLKKGGEVCVRGY